MHRAGSMIVGALAEQFTTLSGVSQESPERLSKYNHLLRHGFWLLGRLSFDFVETTSNVLHGNLVNKNL